MRKAGRVDPLAEHRRQLARTEPDPQLLIVLRAMGHRGDVFSQLHALELFAYLSRGNRP